MARQRRNVHDPGAASPARDKDKAGPAAADVLAALNAALDAALLAGRFRHHGSANTVRRVAARMLEFAVAEGRSFADAQAVEALGAAYADAIRQGRVEAPGSDQVFARNATTWLRSVLE